MRLCVIPLLVSFRHALASRRLSLAYLTFSLVSMSVCLSSTRHLQVGGMLSNWIEMVRTAERMFSAITDFTDEDALPIGYTCDTYKSMHLVSSINVFDGQQRRLARAIERFTSRCSFRRTSDQPCTLVIRSFVVRGRWNHDRDSTVRFVRFPSLRGDTYPLCGVFANS